MNDTERMGFSDLTNIIFPDLLDQDDQSFIESGLIL